MGNTGAKLKVYRCAEKRFLECSFSHHFLTFIVLLYFLFVFTQLNTKAAKILCSIAIY